MPSLSEMLAQKQKKQLAAVESAAVESEVVAKANVSTSNAPAAKAAKTIKTVKTTKVDRSIDLDTWQSLLYCVEVTRRKANRYFMAYQNKLATLKSQAKKLGMSLDITLIDKVPVIRNIEKARAFLAKTKPDEVES